ncbi:MAG: DUF2269 family protein [Solirubrobacterales bacterium]
MIASITLYGFVLAVHIMAVVVAFGVTFAYPAFIPWARKHHPDAMPVVHELTGRIGQRVISPAMVIVLLAGIYLASDADAWSEMWVSVPFVILLVLGGMGGMFFSPNERKLAELAQRDLTNGGGLSAEYDALYQRVAVAGKVASALVLVAIFFMAAKP